MISVIRAVALFLLVAPLEALVVGAGAPARGLVRASGARMQDTPPPPPTKSGARLGGTVDQDGKSNVWAVEPTMNVDKVDKGLLAFAPIIGVAGLAVLAVPLLPILFAANPGTHNHKNSLALLFASASARVHRIRWRAHRASCGCVPCACRADQA